MFLKSRYDLVTGRPGQRVCGQHIAVYGGQGQGKTSFLINDLRYQLKTYQSSWALFLDNENSIQIDTFPPELQKRTVLFKTQPNDFVGWSSTRDFDCLYIDNFEIYSLNTQESFRDIIYKTKRVCITSSIHLDNKIPGSWEKIILPFCTIYPQKLNKFGNAGSIF